MKKKNPKEIYPMTLSDNPFDHQETKMTIKQGQVSNTTNKKDRFVS